MQTLEFPFPYVVRHNLSMEESLCDAYTRDGSLDIHGKPAIKGRTGGWKCGALLLGIVMIPFIASILQLKDLLLLFFSNFSY